MSQQHHEIDDRLANRINSGAEEAFRIYYHEYRTLFFQFTNQLVRDVEVAKDIVSDTYLTCWQLRGNFKSMNDIHSYMYITCRNKAYNYLKYGSGFKSKKEVALEEVRAFLTEDTTNSPILRDIILREYTRELRTVLQQLPDQRRNVIQLLFIEGYSVEEAAARLGMSRELVRTVKSKALAQLRTLLKDSFFLSILLVFLAERDKML